MNNNKRWMHMVAIKFGFSYAKRKKLMFKFNCKEIQKNIV